MSNTSESFSQITMHIQANKNFVFKGKKYPVDFRLIKINSNFFSQNKKQYKHLEDIELHLNDYDITEDSIPAFIACCQNEPFEITDSNVFSLRKLSIQYGVPELNRLSTEYIISNEKNLLLQSIFFKLKNRQQNEAQIDLQQEEAQIATDFFKYIENEQLFQLPIQILYRILNSSQMDFNSMNQTNQGQFIDFLFKCLDHYGKSASVLFLNIDIENQRIGLFSKLLNDYSEVFDFSMLSPKFLLQTSSQLLSELNKLKTEFSLKLNEIQSEFQKHEELINKVHSDEYQDLKNKVGLLETIIAEQSKVIEKVKSRKVTKISIESDKEFLHKNDVTTLTAKVEPENAFEDGVDWTVNHEVENSIEIQEQNEKMLKFKCLIPKKVSFVAKSIDGSEIRATKELRGNVGQIEISVDSDQSIKGSIKLDHFDEVETSMSKYLLNTDSSKELGVNGYDESSFISKNPQEFKFFKKRGT